MSLGVNYIEPSLFITDVFEEISKALGLPIDSLIDMENIMTKSEKRLGIVRAIQKNKVP